MTKDDDKPALRPMLPDDGPALAAIFGASIDVLAAEDYDEDQRAAWMATAEDEVAFAARLGAMLTLVASVEGAPAGFASLKDNSRIEMLYVDPALAGRGIGTLLVDACERLARARGAATLTVDASDSARPLFERRGYRAQSRQSVPLNGEWLANTRLELTFAPA
jgi:putative acetyltransferase